MYWAFHFHHGSPLSQKHIPRFQHLFEAYICFKIATPTYVGRTCLEEAKLQVPAGRLHTLCALIIFIVIIIIVVFIITITIIIIL